MGIRFQCHHCSHPLHVKDYQAGKKGRCPQCKGQFRIPLADAEYSMDPATVLAAVGAEDSAVSGAAGLTVNSESNSATFPQTSGSSVAASTIPNNSVSGVTSPASHPISSFDDQGFDPASFGQTSSGLVAEAAPQTDQPYEINLVQPAILAEAPDATWYVRPALGGQYGPAPAAIFGQWLLEGRIDIDALVWRDDWAQWQPACNVFADYFAQVQGRSTSSSEAAANAGASYGHTGSASNPAAYSPASTAGAAVVAPTGSSNLPISGTEATASAPAAVKRQMKKRSRKTKYMIAIGVLAVLMITLAVGLAVVLYRQNFAS